MWKDEASELDLLFFKPISEAIVELCMDSKNTPLTIGVFGEWGAGKSTILNFIKSEINFKPKCFCIHINAWELEGYDDAKIAIIESVVSAIEQNKTFFNNCKDYFEKFWKNLNLLKATGYLIKKGAGIASGILTGNPISSIAEIASIVKDSISKKEKIKNEILEERLQATTDNIRNVKKYFNDILENSTLDNLVIIIDDLDRCLPNRIIDIFEASKLFLSVDKTAFIYGVDENIVRYAIRQQYPIYNDEDISKEYIEKIIQYPIIIPKLSPKDMQNYLLLLDIQSKLTPEEFDKVLKIISENSQLLKSTAISIEFLEKNLEKIIFEKIKKEYKEIDLIRQCVSGNLNGNPRKAKRFLNSFSIKKKMSEIYFPDCDYLVLAKLMCLYNLNNEAFQDLSRKSFEFDPINGFLSKIEKEKKFENLPSCWKIPSVQSWLQIVPFLSNIDLSRYFYLTRDMLNDVIDYKDKYNHEVIKVVDQCTNGKQAILAIDYLIKDFVNKNPNLSEPLVLYSSDKYRQDKKCFDLIYALYNNVENMREYLETLLCEVKFKITVGQIPKWVDLMLSSKKIYTYVQKNKDTTSILEKKTYEMIMEQYNKEA